MKTEQETQFDVFEGLRYAKQHMRKYDFACVLGHARVCTTAHDGEGRIKYVEYGFASEHVKDLNTVVIDTSGAVRFADSEGRLHRSGGLPASYGKHYTQYFEHGVEKMCIDEKGMIRYDGKTYYNAYGVPREKEAF